MKQLNWTRILTILLVVLASYWLLYLTLSVVLRFTQAIFLFILGAILAYVLTPFVNALERVLRYRWLGILATYCLFAGALVGLALLLFTPFIDQSKSLVDNLHNPTTSSLRTISTVRQDAFSLSRLITVQTTDLRVKGVLGTQDIAIVNAQIGVLQVDLAGLRKGKVSAPSTGSHSTPKHGLPPNPQPQTHVPPSYIKEISTPLAHTSAYYSTATRNPGSIDETSLALAQTASTKVLEAAGKVQHTMATTPILLLRAQTWLDQHRLKVDVSSKFGQAARQLSDQGTLVLDNAITILSKTANALLDITLVLIISFYLLNDGRRILRHCVDLLPADYREQGTFFLQSVDRVLGGYIRGQLFLSVLAGVLGGGGAAALGVPYPLLIGIITAVLQMIPVIGPLVVVLPAVGISLVFMPIVTTVLLLVWYLIFQQIVTNVLGPRIMGIAVGIHPLEALFAVLVGYPVASFLGAFLAVPVAGIIHILVREAYHYFAPGRASTRPAPSAAEADVPTGAAAGGTLSRRSADATR